MTRELGWSQRMGARLVATLTRLTTGYSPPGLAEEWVSTFGLVRFFRFGWRVSKVLGRLERSWGEVNTQFLAGLSAAWNGCGFCGYGHVLTGSLLHFREHGALHPLDPRQIERMMDLPDERIPAHLDAVLGEDDHQLLRTLARRMFDLKMGHVEAEGPEDELLVATAWAWTWTVECTITLGLTIEPHEAVPYGHPIYRDHALRARYRRAWDEHDAAAPGGGSGD